MNECHFLEKAISRLASADDLGFVERIKLLLEVFDDIFGPDSIMVDSSKCESYLDPLVSYFSPNKELM